MEESDEASKATFDEEFQNRVRFLDTRLRARRRMVVHLDRQDPPIE
jgi:hypothetical protein